MNNCQVYVNYKNIYFVVTVETFDFQPAEKQTFNYPGCPASAVATAGYVEIDGEVFEPNAEELAVIAQVESDNAALFTTLCDANSVYIEAVLLAHVEEAE